jgi:uncharacterized protein (TIGR00725 family)
MAYQVAVCGPASCSASEEAAAYRVGELLAEAGAVVLCGGGTGVMAAVAEGARSAGGLVVNILPDERRDGVGINIVTNLGQARNAVLVWSADAVIVVGGSWGTLSELALAMRRGGIPVVSLGGWRIVDGSGAPIDGIEYVETPEAAVAASVSGN